MVEVNYVKKYKLFSEIISLFHVIQYIKTVINN